MFRIWLVVFLLFGGSTVLAADRVFSEAELLAVGREYARTYNSPEEFSLVYAPDLVVNDGVYRGRDKLVASEKAFLKFAPKRSMRVDHMHVSGTDTVIVRGVILDPDRGEDWNVPFSAFLTVNEDGLIARDYTYADFTKLLAPKD